MQIHVINLAGDAQRWQSVRAQFEALGLRPRRCEAVDGAALDAAQRGALYDAEANARAYHRGLRPGEIGCYASHLAAWRALLDSGEPQAAVFEDDIELSGELPRVLAAIARLPREWDLVKLIGRPVEKIAAQAPLLRDHALIAYERVPSLTAGYVVSRRGATLLLQHRARFARPVDVDMRYWWECGLTVLGVQPYPVRHAPCAQQSTIDARDGRAVRPDLAMRLRKLALQAHYSWANHRAGQARRRADGRVAVPQVQVRRS